MNYQKWIEGIDGLASLYSFDVLPDGSYSEIRLMAVNKQNTGMLQMNPNAPEFYPGIPYRNYWMDLNFESFVYKCATTREPLYSYVNARGVWLKGFYIPIVDAEIEQTNTFYCLYIIVYSDQVETDNMSQKSSDVAKAVMDISIKLHETPDFYQAMTTITSEIKSICEAEKCSIFIVDKNNQKCDFISGEGLRNDYMKDIASKMQRTPYEMAEAWERDLALSDCLLLEDLHVIQERDPEWFISMQDHGIRNLILYAIRYKQMLVGFIWAANYDTSKMLRIKETLELTTFILAATITNHQLVSRLELTSIIDGLTQVGNRNAMESCIEEYEMGEKPLPNKMGVVFADLNGLKVVNDDEGHEAGDRLLIRAAAILKIAFGERSVFRVGGDEFVVLCPDISEEQLEEKVEQLRGLTGNTADVRFAVGTVYCSGKYNINDAIQKADELMYKDKEAYYEKHPDKAQRRN